MYVNVNDVQRLISVYYTIKGVLTTSFSRATFGGIQGVPGRGWMTDDSRNPLRKFWVQGRMAWLAIGLQLQEKRFGVGWHGVHMVGRVVLSKNGPKPTQEDVLKTFRKQWNFVYFGRMERLMQKVCKSILPIRNSICKAKITSIRIAHSPQEPARRELQGGLHAPTEEIRPCLWHLCHLCRGTHWALGGSQVIVYGWSISTDARDWAQVQTWVWGDGVNMGKKQDGRRGGVSNKAWISWGLA